MSPDSLMKLSQINNINKQRAITSGNLAISQTSSGNRYLIYIIQVTFMIYINECMTGSMYSTIHHGGKASHKSFAWARTNSKIGHIAFYQDKTKV